MNYTLQFYSNPSNLKNSEYDPQNAERQSQTGFLFELDMKLKLVIDNETLKFIAESKEFTLIKNEQDLKFKRDKHLGVIEDAIFPFANLKFSIEKGFSKKESKKSGKLFRENNGDMFERDGG